MDKFEKKPITGGSNFFQSLTRTSQYKRMEKLVQKSLEDQWNDIIISGVIKTLYNNYYRFFINRRGIRIKLKKHFKKQDEDDIRSEAELRALARENLQQDKISVAPRALNMVALTAFIVTQVGYRAKNITSYNRFKPEMNSYLKNMSNRGGQSIIDQIKTPKPIKFRLSKKELVNQIKSRTDTLIKGLNKTTKSRLVNQLAIGIRKGERKSVMISRLQRAGLDISKERARKIVMTETVAVSEWSRGQTALMNGATTKIWETAEDERVCPVCEPLNGAIIGITGKFHNEIPATETRQGSEFSGGQPPAHALCRCTVRYEFRECSEFVKSKLNIFDRVTELFNKAKGAPDYKLDKEGANKCQNPEAVWAGGESMVGKDKEVGTIYNEIKDLDINKKKVALLRAESKLTPEGYAQLRLKLGLTGQIKANTKLKQLRELIGGGATDRILLEYQDRIVKMKKLGLTSDSFTALRGYTDKEYIKVNTILREGIKSKTEKNILSAYKESLDKTFGIIPVYKGKVYRGVSLPNSLLFEFKEGKVVSDASYVSASTSKNTALGFMRRARGENNVIFSIGSKQGIDISEFTSTPGEGEVLFSRDSKFKVNNILKSKQYISGAEVMVTEINMEEIISKKKKKKALTFFEDAMTIADKQKIKIQLENNIS